MTTLAILDRRGAVHRVLADGSGCYAIREAHIRVPVTTLQCLVYKLPPCGSDACWPASDAYARLVHGGKS